MKEKQSQLLRVDHIASLLISHKVCLLSMVAVGLKISQNKVQAFIGRLRQK